MTRESVDQQNTAALGTASVASAPVLVAWIPVWTFAVVLLGQQQSSVVSSTTRRHLGTALGGVSCAMFVAWPHLFLPQ